MNNPSEVVNDERKYKIQRIEVDFSAKTKLTSLLGSENAVSSFKPPKW